MAQLCNWKKLINDPACRIVSGTISQDQHFIPFRQIVHIQVDSHGGRTEMTTNYSVLDRMYGMRCKNQRQNRGPSRPFMRQMSGLVDSSACAAENGLGHVSQPPKTWLYCV